MLAAVALAAGATLGGSPASAPAIRAAEPSSSPNRLDHPIVDLAVLGVAGPDDAPRLLTVGPPDADTGAVRLSILQRDREWDLVDEYVVDLSEQGLVGADPPWLIGLGPATFVLIAGDESGDTLLLTIRTDGGDGANRIAETGAVVLDHRVDAAAAADVDGDGAPDLVVADDSAARQTVYRPCPGSLVEVYDTGLSLRASTEVTGRELTGGVVGAFDETPGDDLLVYARATCKAEPTDPSSRLLLIRLADGHLSLDRPSPDEAFWAGSPIRFDTDGDGRHEAIVRDAGELVLLDPTRDWRRTRVAGVALPIVAASAATQDGQATRIAWLQADSSGASAGAIGTARISRTGAGLELDAGEEFDFDPADEHSAAATIALIETAGRLRPPVGWFADVDTDGCPVLIVPLVIRSCGAADTVRPGASWIATRPLFTIGVGDRRRLLVAGGLDWGDGEMPATPAPLAAAPVGWWRHGPSEAFALSELRAADLTYFREFPTPRATIERVAAADRTTNIPAFTGSRLFVASVPLGEDQADPDAVASSIDGLVTEPDDHVRRTVARVEVPPGLEAGRDGSVATIPLGDATLRDGTQVDRWSVTVVPINDWGEVGPPASGTVERDLVGPSLALDVPMVTPVWPLPAKLTGASDPDTTVVVDGIGEVKLDRRGRFELVTQLAPWPQTLRLSAVDPSGNVTRREVSVVGGVDYRRFPWPIIAAVALLVLVAVSGVLGSRRIRPAAAPDGPHRRRWVWPTVGLEATPARADADDGPVIEIEELPPGAGLPRT